MAKLTPESAWEFADAIKAIVKPQTTRRRATVQSVDKDGTIWVNLPGSSTVTPIQSTGANVSPGDTVLTELRGTSLHITENQTSPAIGENTARSIARQETQHAEQMAQIAKGIADEANAVAQATNQHFWDDTNGAHVTDVTQDEWTQAVADNFSDYDPDTKPYHNQLLNSLGILLRTALNNLVSITRSAIAFYDGQGNAASNIVARFGSDGAQIGKSNAAHSVIDANGQRFYGGSIGATQLANIGYGEGSGAGSVASTTPYYTFGTRATSDFAYNPSRVYTIGDLCRHDGNLYMCTSGTVTGEWNSQYWVLANGNYSFVAGSENRAARNSSQAFGYRTKAVGSYALASGVDSVAWGAAAHAHNRGTFASTNQTAIGKYNEQDYGSIYALIIGNGTADNARSNAVAVTWDGDIETAKDTAWITLNGTIKYRIHHGVCYVCGDSVSGGTSVGTSGTTVGTLPTGARPSITVNGAASTKSNAANGQFSIDSSGVITVWNLQTSSPYWCFTAAFPVG